MLQLNVLMSDNYDEKEEVFVMDSRLLKLEHSLVSLSKWESKYEKPFLASLEKSTEEVLDYVMMMDLGEETPPEVFQKLTNAQYNEINDYINAKMTATWFNRRATPKANRQVVTSELIYYWLTSYEIPWEAERWHLNRLFTLIEVFNEERGSKDKKTKRPAGSSLAEERRALNEQRRKEFNTSG
jgi:hypothetical protein